MPDLLSSSGATRSHSPACGRIHADTARGIACGLVDTRVLIGLCADVSPKSPVFSLPRSHCTPTACGCDRGTLRDSPILREQYGDTRYLVTRRRKASETARTSTCKLSIASQRDWMLWERPLSAL